jgi:galactokinase
MTIEARTIGARAHGRVNLIGDHTDYTGGFVLPMAIEPFTEITGEFVDDATWHLTSDHDPVPLHIDLPLEDPSSVQPEWGRYVAAVIAEIAASGRRVRGFRGRVTSNLPIGSGLSSSAALEVAVARIVLGDEEVDAVEIAEMCRRAEHRASGVPCGIMDQLCIAAGTPNRPVLIDCSSLDMEHLSLPVGARITYEFVAPRRLRGSEYATRVAEARSATESIGPLRDATIDDVESIADPVIRRRARHIVTENRRVLDFASAMKVGDLESMGRLMVESHRSMQFDYETSNATMDDAVERTLAEPGVLGARLTGGGFGGCVVALRLDDR